MAPRPMPEVDGVRHSMRRAGELELHVAEAGAGPPLVLLHGWPQHWYEWRGLIGPLSRDYHVICPDLRGFGWSDAPPSGYDRETMARDVLALLDGMGVRRFRLAGHDWGGWIGFLICLFAPDRVVRYLAMNIAHPFAPPTLAGAAQMWRLWYQWPLATPVVGPRMIRRAASGDTLLARWSGTARGWDAEERRVFIGQFEEPARVRASVLLYRSFVLRELPRALAGRYRAMAPLRPPTLLLHGAADHIVRPVHFAGYERYAEDMRVELVEGCGHFIADERPELVADRARSFFIDGLAAAAAR
jgi:pimeloyl-ACP methyl ester carboxylesterase